MSDDEKDKEIQRLQDFIRTVGEYANMLRGWHSGYYDIAEACEDLLVDGEIFNSRFR